MDWLRKRSIRWQLLFVGIVILTVLLASWFWSYYRILDITYERNSEYTQEIMATVRNHIASNADTFHRIMPNLTSSEIVQKYVTSTDPLEKYELFLQLEKPLVNVKSMKQGILEIVLIGTNGNTYNCINCEKDIPIESIPDRTNAYFMGIHPPPTGVTLNERPTVPDYVLYIGAPIYDSEVAAGEKIGYAIMVLDVYAIAPQIDNLSQRVTGKIYVVDRNDRIYAGNRNEEIGMTAPKLEESPELAQTSWAPFVKSNDDRLVIDVQPVPEIDSRIVNVISAGELFRGLEDVQRLIIGIFALLLVVLFGCYLFISRNILRPVHSLMTYIYRIRSRGLTHTRRGSSVEGYAEFSVMADQFNTLLDEIDDLAKKLIDSKTSNFQLRLLKQQAELQFLKQQINPHFLYNTLETMKGIAFVRGVQEIRDIADALSRMFKYSIKGGEYVKLREEVKIVEAYLNIQRIRFGDHFEAVYDFTKRTYDCTIVKMILQPLVENAIFHGIEPKLTPSRLFVGSRVDEEDLVLWVEDDGVGMDASTLDSIRTSVEEASTPRQQEAHFDRHIGILNVHHRIRFTYGEGYGISSIDSSPGRGTKVTIRIPMRGEAEDV